MLSAGTLQDRVSIQARTETSDGHDGLVETWATLHGRWSAAVRELRGRDLERARQADPRTSIEVDFRYWRAFRDDLDGGRVRLLVHPTMQSDDDRVLEIVGPPVESERRVMVTVPCREAA
jgi:head-tail adaptor